MTADEEARGRRRRDAGVRTQTTELEVSDDAGNPTVSVFDDDGTICTVSAPPYTCTWPPTGADVGRATLLPAPNPVAEPAT